MVWDGAEGLTWAGLVPGLRGSSVLGAVSNELEGPRVWLGSRFSATMHCCWGGSRGQLSLLHSPIRTSSAPLRGFQCCGVPVPGCVGAGVPWVES